jgi:hypothetical protein
VIEAIVVLAIELVEEPKETWPFTAEALLKHNLLFTREWRECWCNA